MDQFHNERKDIDFSISSKGMTLFIGDGKLHYQFSRLLNPGAAPGDMRKPEFIGKKNEQLQWSMYRMDVELVGANTHAVAIPEQQQDFYSRFYERSFTAHNSKGRQEKEIIAHTYSKITYKDIYPSIDWVIYTKGDAVEYEFVVRPGGNPANIKFKYGGATGLEVNRDGSLTATTPMGTVKEKAPYSFDDKGKEVASSFNLEGDVLSFNVGSYAGTLTIDPALVWGTYWGSNGIEEYKSVMYDGTGNIFL
ncbi:MAG TPA: hypothetical protein VEB40_07710, partial [Flavipsychrobacter sp.]|nr:hypothetical protein [Flavipsychrobacter sp.]